MSDDARTWLRTGADGIVRCWWPGEAADYVHYHDHEWGRPVTDDRRLYEKLVLEGFQSGLSWLTILRKRENFRAAFAGFDFVEVARFGDADVARLLADAGIVRHRGKIEAAINNAQRALAKVFKGKLLAMMRAEVPGLQVPGSAGRSKWIAHVDVARQGSDIVLKYLSRYVNRTALSDHRIISVTQTHVTFKYQTKDRKSWLTMKVSGVEFLRRFLQHVLPERMQKIRYFGFWSRTRRADLARIRVKLAELKEQGALRPSPSVRVPSSVATPAPAVAEPKWLECPHCKTGRRIVVRHFGRCTDPPPLQQYPGLPPPRPPP